MKKQVKISYKINCKNVPNKINLLGNYDKILNDIKRYNRADTVNMSEMEMNKFRHIAGPAYLTSKYYDQHIVNILGYLKELKDILQGRGLQDTLYDLENNKKGIDIGIVNKSLKESNQKALFYYIFKTQIEPYRNK